MQLSVNADNRAAFSRHSRMLDFQRSSLYASILARSFLAAMPGPHVSAMHRKCRRSYVRCAWT
jgi:hypothetical protein